ncbi:HAMP domain-containing sensor histidine kinase [Segetibacter sp.]|jgi:signal transduction histidine kinase|uniref:sensor histidine kinase n=1 Tax=Segetibacter sp. TaxID=2231182 RepID=UPI00262FF0EB|nr:HAMP domain-containing sensor histidine kinase [Segetibacter sp.]MCW3080274.1 two-component sensor histidine kinase [Segetibacter sp.]
MKIQIKIALLFTLVCTLIIIAVSSAVYYFANEQAFQDFYTRLELRATIAAKANLDTDNVNSSAYEQVRNEHLQRLPDEREYIIRIDSLQSEAKTGLDAEVPQSFFTDISSKKKPSYRKGYRFYKGIYYQDSTGDYAIIISAEHAYARNFLLNLKTILITANLVATIIIFSVGVLFSKQILAPIRNITANVKRIKATSLHKRLTVKQGKDEIAELANTFNNMLARLETSFETQNNFVSNASHELNTPLTVIIGEAEFALSKGRTTGQYQQGLRVILKQAEKLKNLTKSLLELAQSGFSGSLSFEEVRLDELFRNIQKVAASIYPNCSIIVDNSLLPADFKTLSIKGNFHLLELCISNIILNACKYSTGENVTLALALSDRDVIFIIKDKGIGIPKQDMPHIFDPFFRASNVNSSKGYGIGLPLAQNIIKLHNGSIDISSKEAEGTEVVVKFPRG